MSKESETRENLWNEIFKATVCPVCGKQFFRYGKSWTYKHKGKYCCSYPCFMSLKGIDRNGYKRTTTKTCETCRRYMAAECPGVPGAVDKSKCINWVPREKRKWERKK